MPEDPNRVTKEMMDEAEEVLWQEQQAQEAFYQAWLNAHEAAEMP